MYISIVLVLHFKCITTKLSGNFQFIVYIVYSLFYSLRANSSFVSQKVRTHLDIYTILHERLVRIKRLRQKNVQFEENNCSLMKN